MVKDKIVKALKPYFPSITKDDVVFNEKKYHKTRGHFSVNIIKVSEREKIGMVRPLRK